MITITKDTILIERYNGEMDKYETFELESMYDALNQEVIIKSDVTVENLINLLFKYEEEVNKIFKSFTDGFELKKYIEGMNKESEMSKINLYIEFHHFVDLFDGNLICTVELKAYDNGNCINKSVEYIPINDLKHYFIKLNKSFKMNIVINISDGPTTFKGEKEFMFFDVIAKFLYTITLMGYPEDQELNIQNILDDVQNGEFDFGLNHDRLERLLNLAVDKQQYELAEILKQMLNGNE